METPENARQIRVMRNHTPRLSERKKKLFSSEKGNKDKNGEEELLQGIEPLSMISKSRYGNKTPKSAKTMESLIGSCKKSPRVISFFETESEEGDTGEDNKLSPSRRSSRLSLKQSPNSSKSETEFSTSLKENIPTKTHTHKETKEAKKLQKMFTNSMQITPRDKFYMDIEETSSDDETNVKKNLNKRHCEILSSTGLSPARKVAKTSTDFMDVVSISTKSFYSGKNRTPTNNTASRPSCRNLFGHVLNSGSITPTKTRPTSRRSVGGHSTSINRGVHHKVRNRTNFCFGSKHYPPVDIDQILNNVRNEKLRKLITAKREEKEQIEKIHNIFRKASNPIAMARPLSSISNQDDSNNNLVKNDIKQKKSCDIFYSNKQTDTDFSDIECEAEDEDNCEQDHIEDALMAMNEDVIPLITYHGDDTLSLKLEDTSAPVKKKFFKSGCTTSTRKEVHLTGNIKATLSANGKLAIVPEKNKLKKRIKLRNSVANEFSDEQATVDAILRNLDDSACGTTILSKDGDAKDTQNLNTTENNPFLDEIHHQLALMSGEESPNISDGIVLQDDQDFNEFRKRLPYNTTDPEIIERQHLLLEFLITNNICTEDNFNIFIGDPDNHKEEAEKIIDDLVIVVTDHQNTDFRQRIPYNTTDGDVIEQQHRFLDFLLENNICTEENFDIFIANYIERKAEAIAILSQYIDNQCIKNTIEPNADYNLSNLSNPKNINLNISSNKQDTPFENINNITTLPEPILQTSITSVTSTDANINIHLNTINQESQNLLEQKLFPVFYPRGSQPLPQIFTHRKQQRLWNAGFGSNQYQIDAGQKAFGAQQCKQCGLVYTVHEPEEEKLHRDFHASLHILRFKGWIDEDIVAIYPEWGADGRILRLTESSPSKRLERLSDILKIVDKELGFSSYIMPKTFVAYFAVRKMQIVGLCLIQPLSWANKYICVNGVDCCSEEQFEAKCGVSRIWVSPLHRRFHIATKLIQAVQLNTIFGEEVSLDKIAFSAPTELGKVFAQKVAKTENFLVYQ